MTRELNFNVGGDPRDDAPYVQADRKVLPDGTVINASEHPDQVPPSPMAIGAVVDGKFVAGAAPLNRGLAMIPPDHTGGGTVYYQHGSKTFRVILPPVNVQTQAEAGLPPQLPPEYNGDADKVALHYHWITARPGVTRLNGSCWVDDAGTYHPLGATLMWAPLDPPRAKQNFQYIKRGGGDVVRILGKVNWTGQTIDPRDPVMLTNIAQVIDDAYAEGLKVHFVCTGGGDDPVGAAHLQLPVLQARREKLLLIEAVNEENASEDDAIQIAQIMKAVGVPVCVGRGNIGDISAINAATDRAGANATTLHDERTTDPAHNMRQCWDFRLLYGAAVAGEPIGAASSVAEETLPNRLAGNRVSRIVCGAGYYCNHSGHGVYGRTYPYNANTATGAPHSDTRFANLWEAPMADEQWCAIQNAHKRLPDGIENWSKFNSNQPVTIQSGEASKLYGATDGASFAEVAIATVGTIVFRAERPAHLQISDPATDNVVWEGDLSSGQLITVSGLYCYVLVGQFR